MKFPFLQLIGHLCSRLREFSSLASNQNYVNCYDKLGSLLFSVIISHCCYNAELNESKDFILALSFKLLNANNVFLNGFINNAMNGRFLKHFALFKRITSNK